MNQEITPWLPLIVVLVAGIFALFQIKSNNITNARIKWLENLKQVLTDFLSECTILQLKEGVSKGINEMGQKAEISEITLLYRNKLNESTIEHLKIIESKHDLIKLNLNPKEVLHQKLEELLDNYMKLFNEIPEKKTVEEYNALIRKMESHSDTLVLLSRYIMKLEWEKTKRTYLLKKWYMKFGQGKEILWEALELKLLPERIPKHSITS
jgi:hypothetical protein